MIKALLLADSQQIETTLSVGIYSVNVNPVLLHLAVVQQRNVCLIQSNVEMSTKTAASLSILPGGATTIPEAGVIGPLTN